MTKETLGRAITDAMKAKGISQQKMSELTGINKCTLSEVMNGKRNTTIDVVSRICDALDCDIYLLTNEEKKRLNLICTSVITLGLSGTQAAATSAGSKFVDVPDVPKD